MSKLREMVKRIIKEEVGKFDISPNALKSYKEKYTTFNFSTDVDMYGNKELVVDIPKRRKEVKLYQWQGKVNAQVTNGGLAKHNSLEDALDALYGSYGYEAPKSYGSQSRTKR